MYFFGHAGQQEQVVINTLYAEPNLFSFLHLAHKAQQLIFSLF